MATVNPQTFTQILWLWGALLFGGFGNNLYLCGRKRETNN
jgi:hypothetical protein